MSGLESHTCGVCGILFAAPAEWWAGRRRDPQLSFFCPNGHERVFRQSEADKLRLERDRLKQQLAAKDDAIARERRWRCQEEERAASAERRASAARGQVTKLKKRAAAGVCPCCNRTFVDLQRHMAAKHQGFLAEPADGEGTAIQ